jgi:hypothetical protein
MTDFFVLVWDKLVCHSSYHIGWMYVTQVCFTISCWMYSLSLSNGATARGGPRSPSRVSCILPGLGRLFSNVYTLALLHLPPLHLPSATWVSLWGAFLLAHWGGLSWINHHHPGVWHVLPISIYSVCRISQCHSHHTVTLSSNLYKFCSLLTYFGISYFVSVLLILRCNFIRLSRALV